MPDPNINALRPYAPARESFLRGEATPRSFLEGCLETIEARDGAIGAFVSLDAGLARSAADESTARYSNGRPLSPLDGCPVAIKDIIDAAGYPTEMNSALYNGNRPRADATCVAALRRAGAVILGKTVTTEFACGTSGATVNPYDAARTPGASSSGSGAAVGAGMVPAALGTQTAGSVIRPASYCGAYAIKPTHGVSNLGGVHPVSPSRDHLGVLAASLEDMWRVIYQIASLGSGPAAQPVLAGGETLPKAVKPRRLGVVRLMGWAELDAPTSSAVEAALQRLREKGVETGTLESDPALAELDKAACEVEAPGYDVMAYEMRWPYLAYRETGHELSDTIAAYLDHAETVTPERYAEALGLCEQARARVGELARGFDALITLSSSGPAPEGFEFTGSRAFLAAWSILGFPAISLPVLRVAGLPVGMQLVGTAASDARLAALARWTDGALAG